jgi:hypothetical protein
MQQPICDYQLEWRPFIKTLTGVSGLETGGQLVGVLEDTQILRNCHSKGVIMRSLVESKYGKSTIINVATG